jgi:hypothetical protein
MKRIIFAVAIALAGVALLLAQRTRNPDLPGFEMRSVFPRETSPAQYRQVDQKELELLADEGWELVSVMPYVYKNEERGTPEMSPRPMVTQTYPAYFFKRPRPARTPRAAP